MKDNSKNKQEKFNEIQERPLLIEDIITTEVKEGEIKTRTTKKKIIRRPEGSKITIQKHPPKKNKNK